MSETRIDIGHGHEIAFAELDGVRRFLTLYHRAPNGEECACSIFWPPYVQANHRLISMHPLTIEPSVLCRACGDHGFIRDGKWVPA